MKTDSKQVNSLRYTFLLHSSGLGGAEFSTLELIQGLIERGNNIDCIMPAGGGIAEKLMSIGVRVHQLSSLTWWTQDPFLAIEESFVIESILESTECDLVVTVTGVIPQAAIAARKLGIPHIWCLHEFMDIDHGLTIPFSKDLFSRVVVDFSDKIVCNSKSVREHFFSSQDAEIDVIYPYPRNLEVKLDPLPFPENSDNAIKLGLIANFSPGKGHLLLLKALKEINKFQTLVKVLFFGEGGSEELHGILDGFITENSMKEWVEFRGFLESKTEIFGLIHAVVVPSSNEGFGRVPFEAMAFGKPIIYSESGALSEYMLSNELGISFIANDSASLAFAITELLSGESARTKLIDSGHALINRISESDGYILQFIKVSQEVVSNYCKVELKSPLSKLIETYSELTQQRDELTQQRDGLTQQRDGLTQQRDELLNSTIWKTTTPIRWLINAIKP